MPCLYFGPALWIRDSPDRIGSPLDIQRGVHRCARTDLTSCGSTKPLLRHVWGWPRQLDFGTSGQHKFVIENDLERFAWLAVMNDQYGLDNAPWITTDYLLSHRASPDDNLHHVMCPSFILNTSDHHRDFILNIEFYLSYDFSSTVVLVVNDMQFFLFGIYNGECDRSHFSSKLTHMLFISKCVQFNHHSARGFVRTRNESPSPSDVT